MRKSAKSGSPWRFSIVLSELPPVPSAGPTIQLTDGERRLHPFAYYYVLAMMAYPHDERARNDFVAVEKVIFGRQRSESDIAELVASHGGYFALAKAAGADDIRQDITRRVWSGCLAARVLWWIVWLSRIHPTSRILHQAVSLVVEETKQHGQSWGGPKKPSLIYEAWEYYQPAIHLWAVHGGKLTQPQTLRDVFEGTVPLQFSGVRTTMAWTEIYRRIGLTFIRPGSTVPILDPAETCQLPSDFPLLDAELVIDPPLERWVHEILNDRYQQTRKERLAHDEKVLALQDRLHGEILRARGKLPRRIARDPRRFQEALYKIVQSVVTPYEGSEKAYERRLAQRILKRIAKRFREFNPRNL